MKKSKLFIAGIAGISAVFLSACSSSTGSSGPSAPEGVLNEENFNAELTEAEIAEDLTEISEIADINIDLGSNLTLFRKSAKKILGPVSEDCYPIGSSYESGTKGSGDYYFYEMKFLNGSGDEVTSCNIDMNSSSVDWKFVMTDITEFGDSESSMTMDGKVKVKSSQTTATTTFSADFEGYVAEGDKRVDQWGDINMIMVMNMEDYSSTMTYDMSMNLHFLDDMYRCSFDIDFSMSLTDDEEELEMDGMATNSCDLVHGGTTVGKIEWDESGATVYDLEGNEI